MHIGPFGGPELIILLIPTVLVLIILGAIISSANNREALEEQISHEQLSKPLQSWKTSVGFSILGVVCFCFVLVFFLVMISFFAVGNIYINSIAHSKDSICILLGAIVYFLLAIVYIQAIYPTILTDNPVLTSSRAISFWNLFFGGVVFGSIWNGNLTYCSRGYKGRANTTRTLFSVLSAFIILLFGFAILYSFPTATPSVNNSSASTYQSDESSYSEGSSEEENEEGESEERPAPTPAKHFTDKKYGVSMTVPEGWQSFDIRKNKKYKSSRLVAVPDFSNSTSVFYGVQKLSYVVPDIDKVTASSVKEWLSPGLKGYHSIKAKKATYGNKMYWMISGKKSKSKTVDGSTSKRALYTEILARWNGNILYTFEYDNRAAKTGVKAGPGVNHSGFESLMKSVKYK